MIDENNQLVVNGCKLIEIPYLFFSLKGRYYKNILIIGERSGEEGILWTMANRDEGFEKITLIDLNDIAPDSYVEKCVKTFPNINFICDDFLNLSEDNKYDCIVCINVLEHFGMCWGGGSSIMDWNKDLDALRKMLRIFIHRIVITVPAGPPIFYGDCLENGLPFLRRYDKNRIDRIHQLVKDFHCKIVNEDFLYSKTLNNDWERLSQGPDFFTDGFSKYQLHTPNCLWLFSIEHE